MTDKVKAPHKSAGFIDALAEVGTRKALVHYLRETWNELCEARSQLAALSEGKKDDLK
jgi:hypothetical protein